MAAAAAHIGAPWGADGLRSKSWRSLQCLQGCYRDAEDSRPLRDGSSDSESSFTDCTALGLGDSSAAWTVEDSAQLYSVNGWGAPFFSINRDGHLCVSPEGGVLYSIPVADRAMGNKCRKGLWRPVALLCSNQ